MKTFAILCNLKAPPPISGLSHQQFDEHWLRAFAFAMPWYRASRQWETPYAPSDFVEHVRTRIIETLGEKQFPEQLLRPRAPFMLNFAHWMLKDAVFTHAGTMTEEQMKHVMRHDLKRIQTSGVFVAPDEHHPLYSHNQARPETSMYGQPMHVVPATDRDKKFAQKFSSTEVLNAVFHEAVPQVIAVDPSARISEFSPDFRKKLRKVLTSNGALTDDVRNALIAEVESEWVKVSSTEATKKCEAVLSAHGMQDLLSEPTDDVIKKLATLPPGKDMEPVRRSALELLALRCAEGEDVDDLERVIRGMQAYLKEYNLNFCDRPSCGVASLALFVRFTGAERILSRI